MTNFGTWDLLKWVARYLRPYKSLGILLFIGLLLNQAFESFLPYTFKFILDDAITPKNITLLIWLLGGMGLGVVIFSAISFLLDALYAHVGNSLLKDLRFELFQHTQTLDMKYHAGIPKGEILTRFSSDVDAIENIVIAMLPVGIISIFGMLFSSIMLFSLEWRMATVALIGITFDILSIKLLEKRASSSYLARKKKLAELTTVFEENLRAQTIIRGFNLKKFATEGYLRHLNDFYKTSMRADTTAYMIERIPNAGMMIVTVIITAMGAVMVFKDIISIGTLVAFQALMAGTSASVYGVTSVLPFLIDSATSAYRIEEVLKSKPSVSEPVEARKLPALSKGITFLDVDFGYSGEKKILEKINLHIKHGWSVAFVGPSGSGKSSVLNLLQRFYDPDAGEVQFDGQDIKRVNLDDLHAQMSAVFQENFLFNISVRENIRMGKLAATDEEIVAAAKLAEAHDFIIKLENGYDTIAGDQGSRFSVGQRQRIAIARALVRNPPILVLDEATSALDPVTEDAVSKTIQKLGADRTVISVTHRLSPITRCDQIFVLEQGKLVEAGKHEDLLKAQNLYARLWEKQSGFSISDEGVATVTIERLRKMPILDMLNDAQLTRAAAFLSSEKVGEEYEIVRQGEDGDKFYIIVRGKVRVMYRDQAGTESIVSTLSDGDHFGEIAMLKNIPRTTTVISQTSCILLVLKREHFKFLLEDSPKLNKKLNTDLINRLTVTNKLEK